MSVVLLAATVSMGLMAGLFAAFTYSVMPGLARADDRTLVITMQRINEAILNPLFGLLLVGALAFTAIGIVLVARAGDRAPLPWLIAALVLYGVTLAVTFGGNIPLNNLIAGAGDPDRLTDLAALRERFEGAWVRWNIVRAATSTAGFAALSWAALITGR
jgi:uncharacterized membrane protein